MKSITKKEIVRKMCNTAAWELDECQAFNAVSDIPDGEFRKYGTMHFKTVSYIIKNKLDHISDTEEKRAYLDSLIMTYEDMRSEELMDKAVTVISGVGTSVSFYNMITGEKILNIFFWVVLSFAIFILQLSKIILLYIRRYRFYLIILKQFKQELDISGKLTATDGNNE